MKVLLYCLLIMLFVSCQVQVEEIYPDEDWKLSTPEAVGIDKAKMLLAMNWLEGKCGEDGLEELLIIRHGYVIHAGDSVNKAHNIWSCTKSFTSSVLGVLVAEGKCSLDDLAYVKEPLLKELYSSVTLRHFTTMTSGYNALGGSQSNPPTEDWSRTVYKPDLPMFLPGDAFCYWDEAMMMFGRVLTRIAGITLKEYFDQNIGDQIGFGQFHWSTKGELDGMVINNGCTGIMINAKQLARFGYLYLRKGQWKGQQIISEDWVKQATSVQVAVDLPVAESDRANVRGSGSYGYNWWLAGGLSSLPDAPENTYYASGLNHNVCFVIPEWDMVIVRMGVDGNPPEGKHVVWNEFLNRFSKAVR